MAARRTRNEFKSEWLLTPSRRRVGWRLGKWQSLLGRLGPPQLLAESSLLKAGRWLQLQQRASQIWHGCCCGPEVADGNDSLPSDFQGPGLRFCTSITEEHLLMLSLGGQDSSGQLGPRSPDPGWPKAQPSLPLSHRVRESRQDGPVYFGRIGKTC